MPLYSPPTHIVCVCGLSGIRERITDAFAGSKWSPCLCIARKRISTAFADCCVYRQMWRCYLIQSFDCQLARQMDPLCEPTIRDTTPSISDHVSYITTRLATKEYFRPGNHDRAVRRCCLSTHVVTDDTVSFGTGPSTVWISSRRWRAVLSNSSHLRPPNTGS